MPVPQRAERPIAEAPATDAHEIHDSVTGGTPFRPRDLAKDGHVVAVEKSPADPKDNQPSDGHRQRAGVAHAEQRWQKQRHADGAGENSTTLRSAHPTIRQRAAEYRARQRRNLDK